MITIKAMRCARGMTQADLATRLGTTAATISRYESGQREPTLPVAAKLAEALGCTINDLIDHKEGTAQ